VSSGIYLGKFAWTYYASGTCKSSLLYSKQASRQDAFCVDQILVNNTCTLLWKLGDKNGNYTEIHYCFLSISDFTLTSCKWGVFGLLEWSQVYPCDVSKTIYT
jgi:hypothetical protein